MKTVAVLHTTPVTIEGLKPHFQSILPDVKVMNFLDESILPEINRAGRITPELRFRFHSLMRQAAMASPDLLLSACSSVGGLMEEGAGLVSMPALRIDEPMLRQAAATGGRIGVAATLASTLDPTVDLLLRCAEQERKKVQVNRLLISEAGPLLSAGKTDEYLGLTAQKISGLLEECDLVVLAQASMAGALKLIPDGDRLPVMTSPASGIAALKKWL